MKSSSGDYFLGLDHVRALAALMVFTWHFIHVHHHTAPPPIFPLSLFSEGHTGVALFMTLSGYLFAKLLDGKEIVYRSFIWNRFLRLFPLLALVTMLVGLQRYLAGQDLSEYAASVLAGVIRPTLPNGGWSITVEFHFYLLLPLLLYLARKSRYALILMLAAAIAVRVVLRHEFGQVQSLAYWTIIGRIDQFLCGMIAYEFRERFMKKHLFTFVVVLLFAAFYWYFDWKGGWFLNPSYPSPSPIWVFLPAFEGAGYAAAIAWYDHSFEHSKGPVSRFVALIGTYSYSIYLLHFFFVFEVATAIDRHIIDMSNIYLAMFLAPFFFLLMIPLSFISFRYVESPFLRMRSRYIVPRTSDTDATAGDPEAGTSSARSSRP